MARPKLRELRIARGLTQTALGNIIGCNHGFISQLETGGRKGSVETFAKLAAALECSIDELLEAATPVAKVRIPRARKAQPARQRQQAASQDRGGEQRARAEFTMLQDRRRQLVADLGLVDAKLETLLRVI